MPTTITKYNSVNVTLGRPLPSWVSDPDDAVRVAAYDAYDDMYRNVPNTFKVAMRGTNDMPIYVPSTMRIIEATNRYLALDWTFTVTSATENAAEAATATTWLTSVYTNNKVPSKFYSFKRGMLKRGDAIMHVFADFNKPAGQRIRVVEIHPRTYFPIVDPTDPEGLEGVYIVNLITVGDPVETIIQRQSYRYTDQGIFSQLEFFEPGGWDDRYDGHPEIKPVPVPASFDTPGMQAVLDGVLLPKSVTKIPVYHVANNREDEDRWGNSQVNGMETLVAATNQTVSDEDISLALQGLGMYVTTSGAPVDEEGNATDWIIEPGYVVELKAGQTFGRVPGIDKLGPFQDHLEYIGKKLDESAGLSAVAVGNVDATVAASGVALRLDMAPILSQNKEKEGELKTALDEIGNDLLQMWSPVDQVSIAPDVTVADTFGDPLPVDRAGTVLEITSLVTAGLMSKEFALGVLKAKLGYDFPSDMLDSINADADAEAARVTAELGAQNAANGSDPANPNSTTDPGAQARSDNLAGV